MIFTLEGVNNLENFNNVDIASRVNIIFRNSRSKEIQFYGELKGVILTLFISHLHQRAIEEILYSLNNEGYVNIELVIEPVQLYENTDSISSKANLTLDGAKKIKIQRLKIRFRNLRSAGSTDVSVIRAGMLLDNSQEDILNFEAYHDLLASGGATSGTIRSADDQFYELTLLELEQSILVLKQDALGLFQWKWGLEAQINSANTIAELDAISF